MIDSKEKYLMYLNKDRIALGMNKRKKNQLFNPFEIDIEIWKFQKSLRLCEYLYNVDKKNFLWKIRKFVAALKFKRLSLKLGFTIPVNCFGPGLRIMHRGTIVVNGKSRIGADCTINVCVNIGTKAGYINKTPIIGNNVYIGPGAKLYGDIFIANGCAIGANAVVNKNFLLENSIIVGVPAKHNGYVDKNLSVH